MKSPFVYTVLYFNGNADDNSYSRSSGLGFASSYSEAAEILEESYGVELVKIMNLELLEENELVYLPEDVLENISKDKYWAAANKECDSSGEIV